MPPASSQNQVAAPEQELIALLGAAFPLDAFASPYAVPAIRDWQTLAGCAQENGLTAMLLRAVEILKRTDVPDEIERSLRDIYRRNALAQSLAYRELASVADECASANIPIVLLKGAALAKTLYPETALRPFGDLDVLIHRRAAVPMREMLLKRGLTEADVTHGFDPEFYGEMAFNPTRTREFAMDLHWELVAPTYYRRRMDLAWFWNQTGELPGAGQRVLVFQPTAQFVHLAAHVGLHHQDHVRLIWLYDLALLISRCAKEINWAAADSFARQAGLARPLRAMLDETRKRWGIHLPPETEILFHPSPWALRERTVYAITTTRFPEARMLSDALSTPGLGSKVRFVRQHLFPDASYMRTRYGISNDTFLPFYYARRVLESGFKFVRSVWTAVTRN